MKKTTSNKVNKSLTPEEKAILGNIRSLLEQLDAEEMSDDMNAPAMDEAEVAMSADDPDDIPEPPEDDGDMDGVVKACDDDEADVQKSSTPDEVANNGAEERMNAEDADIENALAVLKAYMARGSKKQTVNKSAAYARLEAKVDDLTNAVSGILEGFGVANSVRTKAPVAKSSRDIMSRLEAIVNKSAKREEADGTLSDVMTSLFK